MRSTKWYKVARDRVFLANSHRHHVSSNGHSLADPAQIRCWMARKAAEVRCNQYSHYKSSLLSYSVATQRAISTVCVRWSHHTLSGGSAGRVDATGHGHASTLPHVLPPPTPPPPNPTRLPINKLCSSGYAFRVVICVCVGGVTAGHWRHSVVHQRRVTRYRTEFSLRRNQVRLL